MIFSSKAGEEDEYPTTILSFQKDSRFPLETVVDPVKLRGGTNTSYSFFINGYLYYFNISNTDVSPIYKTGKIKKDGTLLIPVLEGQLAREFLRAHYHGSKASKK